MSPPLDTIGSMMMTPTRSGVTASVMRIEDIRAIYKYDGIWACASLVHLEHVEIKRVLQNLIKGLKSKGLLFVSFKRGVGRVFESGRPYTLFDETTLRYMLEDLTGVNVAKLWVSDDLRSSEFRQWLNAVVQKKSVRCPRQSRIGHIPRYCEHLL